MSIINGEKVADNITLTAEVLITLATLTRLTGEITTDVRNAQSLAANYLAEMLPFTENPFTVSIVTYALTRVGHQDRGTAFLKLRRLKREGICIL